jgi:hypothetical protein
MMDKMNGNIAIIECKQKRWVHQELPKAQNCIRQTRSRLRGGRPAMAPTLEPATSNQIASQMDVAPQGIDMVGKLQLLEKQANCGHGQHGH